MSSFKEKVLGKNDTPPWKGSYAPYDLIKEAFIATVAVICFAVILALLFSSPDDPPSTIAQWSQRLPVNFATTGAQNLAGTSPTAEYGPPYNNAGEGQKIGPIAPQKWLGVAHPVEPAQDMVIGPLSRVPQPPVVIAALHVWKLTPDAKRKEWAKAYSEALENAKEGPNGTITAVKPGSYGPVPVLIGALTSLAQSGGLEGQLLESGSAANRFYNNDYTIPLLFMADGGLLEERAEQQHLLGDQWGMMNETGSYPGQVWLWLYSFWYQIEPFKSSENADILVMSIMGLLTLAFICIPIIPGVRSIPRWIPLYKVIWREHYASNEASAAPPATGSG